LLQERKLWIAPSASASVLWQPGWFGVIDQHKFIISYWSLKTKTFEKYKRYIKLKQLICCLCRGDVLDGFDVFRATCLCAAKYSLETLRRSSQFISL
jgi:hypothetical protein